MEVALDRLPALAQYKVIEDWQRERRNQSAEGWHALWWKLRYVWLAVALYNVVDYQSAFLALWL